LHLSPLLHASPFHVAPVALSALSAHCDWRKRQIPDWVTIGPLPLAPLAWGLFGYHAEGGRGVATPLALAALSVLGAALCAAAPLLLFRLSMIGGADVKLLATLGALAAPAAGLRTELLAFLLAAALLPARLAYRGALVSTLLGFAQWCGGPFVPAARRAPLPGPLGDRVGFTPFVFAATLLLAFVPGIG
jgi:prepilin peptidase CpaA